MSPEQVDAALVEKAARAMFTGRYPRGFPGVDRRTWDEIGPGLRERYLDYARHALAAVLPDVYAASQQGADESYGIGFRDGFEHAKQEVSVVQAQTLEATRARIEKSFDHTYQDMPDRHPEAEHAEGYLHRDRQVRTVLALEAARLTATTEEKTA